MNNTIVVWLIIIVFVVAIYFILRIYTIYFLGPMVERLIQDNIEIRDSLEYEHDKEHDCRIFKCKRRNRKGVIIAYELHSYRVINETRPLYILRCSDGFETVIFDEGLRGLFLTYVEVQLHKLYKKKQVVA